MMLACSCQTGSLWTTNSCASVMALSKKFSTTVAVRGPSSRAAHSRTLQRLKRRRNDLFARRDKAWATLGLAGQMMSQSRDWVRAALACPVQRESGSGGEGVEVIGTQDPYQVSRIAARFTSQDSFTTFDVPHFVL